MDKFKMEKNDKNSNGVVERYIQFSLGNEAYAIHLLSVKEVIPVPGTTPLPNCPGYYVGIMNLRGQIISIIDLRKKLSVTPKNEGLEEAVMIIEIEGIGIGVIVDSINKVLNIDTAAVSEVPEVSSQINAKYIEGVHKGDERLTVLLDMVSVLNINEIKNMHKRAA